MRRQLTHALIMLPVVLASVPALAQSPADPPDYWHDGWGWGHMISGSLMMILIWGGLIALIVLAVRWFGTGRSDDAAPLASSDNALDILEERFARGEIDKEEFEECKRLLSD